MSEMDFSTVLEAVAEQGYFIGEGFWPLADARAMAEECRDLQRNGGFRPATVGRAGGQARREEIRSDWIHWLEPESSPPAIGGYLAALDEYRLAVNQSLYLGLFDFEGHAALYPKGAHYGRHLDRFQDSDLRTLTAILYLNEDWQAADGGYLRFYPEPDKAVDVAPRMGTFVSFLAADYWHEVLPANRERLALTGWFRRRGAGV